MKRIVSALLALGTMTPIALPAQTFNTLVSFDHKSGEYPGSGTLVQGLDGDFYGTTSQGGSAKLGTVFAITPGGKLKSLVSFNSTNGSLPYGGLMPSGDGTLYGTTSDGAASHCGSIFKISPGGTLATLLSFDCTNGDKSEAALTQGFDGALYGATDADGPAGGGTVFSVTPSGTLTTLNSFSGTGGPDDGAGPLVQAANGKLYGTTVSGGAFGYGTVYTIDARGAFATLYSFDGTGGATPVGALVQASDGYLYGTAATGGSNGDGVVFRITPAGSFTVLHSFGASDGSLPNGSLVEGADGNLYGTTALGGANNGGAIFRMTPSGALTTLYDFCSQSACTDGMQPESGLVQGTDGVFYGTTTLGGAGNQGTVFSLDVGLSPFVKTVPAFGKIQASIAILGTDLTGASSVTIDGTPAEFSVLSPTSITLTVPPGAITGMVQVVTPGGKLSGNVPFEVLP